MRLSISPLVMGLAVVVLWAAPPALASSDDAWAEFDSRVTKACVQASGIRNPRPSTIVGFDDRVGMVAMLVSDRKRGSTLSKLCLYDKKTRKAFVDDAETWSAPPQAR
ncbi:hypothetical protein GCM10011390_02800 [Aureimonas endophytica]|uniref:Uncharacterized protein n=2 Tax=Aureimonas endophytica TaxID=2027858 RepID=A0A916ZC98_9HYPH|nr:hypothetical protein GCM10011390_02800 [Aureimonas endophytica]